MLSLKKIIPIFIIAVLAVIFGKLLFTFPPAKSIDDQIADINIRYFSPATNVSEDIVLILFDEETMKELPYRSPIPRNFLAQLNDNITKAKPKIIGYDIFFKDPTIDMDDENFATSLAKSPAFAVSAMKQKEDGAYYVDLPLNSFFNALKGVGLSDLPFSSSDSTVRRAQFQFEINGSKEKSFVATLLSNLQKEIPNEDIRIRFAGVDAPLKKYPARFVAHGLVPDEWLKDKIVLVGASFDDGTDAYITPYYSARYNYKRMPGVEIHANILNQILTGQFYNELSGDYSLIILVFACLATVAVCCFCSLPIATLFTVILSLSFFAISILLFNKNALIIPTIPFEGSIFFAFGASVAWKSVTEGRQKRFIKNVFSKYVPPAVVDKMIANPKLLTLGGETREITCLFTDIASFTTISEKLDPKTLVQFLNEYLDKLTRIIFNYGGTLDKYEGDAIIAFFGAPVSLEDHRLSCLRAALEMQKANAEISKKWKDVCGREIVTRIGINSGTAVVGNMGSDLRFDYTAIGDAMNLASRLEGANKFFGTKILAGASVVSKNITDKIVFKPVANVKVKGKTEVIKVYEVLGLASETNIENWPEPNDVIELTSK